MDRFTPALGEVNTRLKAAGFRCRIERRGDRLHLVATLPEKSGTGRRQQRLPLGLEANLAGLGAAEGQAMTLGLQLRQGQFSWSTWSETPSSTPTLDEFHATAKRLFAERYDPAQAKGASAWARRWRPALASVPTSGELSQALLLGVVEGFPPRSAQRNSYGGVLAQVAAACGLDPAPIRTASAGYSVRNLTPRDLPEDAEIEQIWGEIKQPQWRWMFGVCAAYGLRPHEAAEVQLT